MTSSPSASKEASRGELRLAFLAVTSLTFLKPLLRKTLRPVAARLYEAGVTANQVTLMSLVGSVLVGAFLCRFAAHSSLFAILPAWLAARTAFAAIDGTLAIEFGQKEPPRRHLEQGRRCRFGRSSLLAACVCSSVLGRLGRIGRLLRGHVRVCRHGRGDAERHPPAGRPTRQGRPIDCARACCDSDRRLRPPS
jgi:hypothetical protein